MSGVTPEIAADFIVEAQEILDRLGEQLVALEHAPDDREQLNAVFRGFHTLKGGAGFLGIHAMVELCHAAEETLGSVRAGQAVLEVQHFDAAQRSLDWLQSMLDAVAGGTEPVHAPAELIAQFSLDPVARPVPVAAAPVAVAASASYMIDDDEFEALLDQLHGAAAPGAASPAPPPARPAAAPGRSCRPSSVAVRPGADRSSARCRSTDGSSRSRPGSATTAGCARPTAARSTTSS